MIDNCNICNKNHPLDKNKYCTDCKICVTNKYSDICLFHKKIYIINDLAKIDYDNLDDKFYFDKTFNENRDVTFNIECCVKSFIKKDIAPINNKKIKWYQKIINYFN